MITTGFFEYIRNLYGNDIVMIMKKILKITKSLASFNNRRIFLLQCRMKNIIPNHIVNNIKCIYSLQLINHPYVQETQKILNGFRKSILRLEIKITINKLHTLNEELKQLYNQLQQCVDYTTFVNFNSRATDNYNFIYRNIKNNNINKLRELEEKYGTVQLKMCDKFIYNYTDVALPIEQKRILATGPKMSVPLKRKEISIPNIIKDVEYNIALCNIPESSKTILRGRAVNVLTNFYNNIDKFNKYDQILKDFDSTKVFLKNNDNIIILNSDKGNSTVIMYKEEYINAMQSLLDDRNMYQILNKDPTTIFNNKAKDLIDKLYTQDYITNIQRKKMKKSDTVVPKLYGMRKTHKSIVAMRPVVSCINSPSYDVAKLVHVILSNYINTFEYNVTNSIKFVEMIRNITLPKDYVFISLDVVSLFTNIPKDLFITIIKEEWKHIQNFTRVNLQIFLELINFIFDTSYFKFNGIVYKQLDGSAMGNPASPSIANIVMNYLIKHTIKKLNFIIPVLKIYVDDLVLAVPKNKIEFVVSCFNNFNSKLKFTVEIEKHNMLPFLDVCIIRNEDGTISTDWHRKPTASGRTLNYLSNHPIHQKKNVVTNLLHKVQKLSSEKFFDKNVNIIKRILMNNNYPSYFINRIIKNYLMNNKKTSVSNHNSIIIKTDKQETKYLKFQFIPQLSNKLEILFKNFTTNEKIIFYKTKTINNLFTKLKDQEDKLHQSNLIYKINCNDCNSCYIGQTKQFLKNRLTQHKYDCKITNINKEGKTALAHHHFSMENHNFNFDDVTILDKEKNWLKRNISEMVFIEINKNNINFKTDTQNLNPFYKSLLNNYKKCLEN